MLRSQVLRVSFSSRFGSLSCVFQRFLLSLLLRRGSFDNSRVESDEWNVFIKRPTRIMNDPIDNNLMPTLHTEMFPRYMHLRRSIRKKHRLIRPCLINPFYRASSLFFLLQDIRVLRRVLQYKGEIIARLTRMLVVSVSRGNGILEDH